MKYFQYTDKENNNRKAMAIDALNILDTMSEMEEYTGSTKDKIYDIYYELKRQVRQIVTAEPPKEEEKKDD